jgi:hypothetical protein
MTNLRKQKCLFFKNRKQERKTSPVWESVPVGGGEGYKDIRKESRRANMVEIQCTHVLKFKK